MSLLHLCLSCTLTQIKAMRLSTHMPGQSTQHPVVQVLPPCQTTSPPSHNHEMLILYIILFSISLTVIPSLVLNRLRSLAIGTDWCIIKVSLRTSSKLIGSCPDFYQIYDYCLSSFIPPNLICHFTLFFFFFNKSAGIHLFSLIWRGYNH